VLNAKEVCRAG